MTFGHTFKKTHFSQLGEEVVPVNHGSFGLPPKSVVEAFHTAIDDDLAHPEYYIRIKQEKEYLNGLKLVADFLNCRYKDLALVENATTAVNTVLRSLPFEKGDKIAIPSTTYGACANTVKFLAELMGIEVVLVETSYPLLDSAVIAIWREVFATHKIKLALFDTVVSMPGVQIPYVELTNLCKEYGVLSLVDGAHLIGLIPVDFAEFRPDFYTSNLHKWLSVPRGCACLYVAPEHHRTIQSLPVSHLYVPQGAELLDDQVSTFLYDKFKFIGSKTFAAVACIPEALKFRAEVCGGEEKIRDYCFSLARKVGKLAETRFPGAKVLENDENSLVTAMVSVVFPIENYSTTFDASDPQSAKELVADILEIMLEKHKTFVPFAPHAGKMMCRLSCQVYNEESDYEYAFDAVDASLKAFFDKTTGISEKLQAVKV